MKLLSTGLLTLFSLLLACNSLAQPPGKKVQFGLRVGANFSQLATLGFQTPPPPMNGLPLVSGGQLVYDFFRQNDSRTTGLVGGLFARFGRRLFIQPELLVSAKGGSFDLIQQGLLSQTVTIRTTTIDLPVLVGLRLGPVRLNAGPMASLAVSQSGTLNQALQQYTTQSIGQTVQQAQFGYQAGLGLTVGSLQVDLRREGSLSDLSSIGIQTPASDARFTTKARLWQLTVGFSF